MIRVIETNNADDYDYDDFVVGDYVVDINLSGGSKYHGVFSTYEDACDHIDKNLPNNNGDYDKYISKRNKPSKKKGLFKKLFKRESNKVRMAEAYRDYEDPRALERQLQDFMKKHPNKSEWSDYDYETYYDLKDRINFAWQDEEYDMDIYDESYPSESKLTESDFTGDPLLPDVKDVYEELIRMYDVRKDVGYVETAKKMAEYVGGKANVSTSRTSLDNDYMEINWKVYGDFEFDGRNKTSYDGRNSILSDSYGNWLMYIEDLCMAFYKTNGGKGGYTPDLIKAIGKGY